MASQHLLHELSMVLARLSDEQLAALLQQARQMDQEPDDTEDSTKSAEARNKIVGMISGDPDLGERSEDIIRELTEKRGAWTQKDGS